jgi:hypothetical protein
MAVVDPAGAAVDLVAVVDLAAVVDLVAVVDFGEGAGVWANSKAGRRNRSPRISSA